MLRTRKATKKGGVNVGSIIINVMMLYIGFFLGARMTQMSHDASSDHKSSLSLKDTVVVAPPASPNELNKKTNEKKSPPTTTVENRWHPIHVFYGDIKHLNLPRRSKSFSQASQDREILALLNQKTKGYFVDLAANDAVQYSNTLSLERDFDWHGLCIEPNPDYWYRLSFRKCDVAAVFAGREMMDEVTVKFSNGIFGGIVGDGFDNKDDSKSKLEKRFTATLDHVFQTFDTPRVIDYLSLDVEGAEEFIMKDFPFDSYKFLTMTVERPNKALQKILNDHGYKFVKTLTYWGETVWVHSDHAKENNIKVSSEPPKWDEARVVHGD